MKTTTLITLVDGETIETAQSLSELRFLKELADLRGETGIEVKSVDRGTICVLLSAFVTMEGADE